MAQELRGGEKVSGAGLREEFMNGAISNTKYQVSKQQKKWTKEEEGLSQTFGRRASSMA